MSSAHIRSPFTAEQLVHWRTRLLVERRKLLSDIHGTEDDALSADTSQSADAGDHAQMQQEAQACRESATGLVAQIDDALRRIDLAEPVPFGICEHCRTPIEYERLQLMPWTAWCLRAAKGAKA